MMDTPIYNKLAFLWGRDYVNDYYWAQPWLEFVRIADAINTIGSRRGTYQPIVCSLMFTDPHGGVHGIAL